jgi:hypothetical protein
MRIRGPARRRSRTLGWPIVLACVLLSMTAQAGPPFVTDDPDIPPLHGWEINIPITLEREGEERVLEAPLVDINYGYRANLQLMVEVALLDVRTEDGGKHRGLGDTLLGLKWRFLEEGPGQPQVAFYPQVTIPTGDRRLGLGEGKPSYILPLVAQKSWGPWTAFANVGAVVRNAPEARNFWFQGLVVTRELSDRLELGAELYGNSPADWDEPSSSGFNIGGTWKVADPLNVLFSAGRTFRAEKATTVYVGVQLLAGGSEAKTE